MRTEYRFFSESSGFVSNIFHFEEDWEQPNNFTIPDILFWLHANRKKRGHIGLEGFFSVEHIASELQRRGYVRADVLAACTWLVRQHLIEADHMRLDKVEFEDCVKLTASGHIHLRILCERFEYLYGVLTVTPIFGTRVADTIADFIKRETKVDRQGPYQQAQCIEEFLKYLKFEHARLSAAYPEFAGEQTGASYVIRQVESALTFFRNPELAKTRQRNLLDLLE